MKTLRFSRRQQPARSRVAHAAFTLIELLVAVTIMILLLLMVFSMVDQTQKTWSRASAEANQYREARLAFETMTRRIRQATLNTYWDYKFNNQRKPTDYIRQSELHFVCGRMDKMAGQSPQNFPGHGIFFQAPFGYSTVPDYEAFTDLVNAWGYFVEFTDDRDTLPPFVRGLIQPKFRYRLKEFRLPTEDLLIYKEADRRRDSRAGAADLDWFVDYLGSGEDSEFVKRTVAENVLTMAFLPMKASPKKGATASDTFYKTGFAYDSRFGLGEDTKKNPESTVHLLPALIKLAMVCIDEKSAAKIERGSNPPGILPSGLFERPQNLENDLRIIEEQLLNFRPRMDFRIFATTVSLREARWIDRSGVTS